MSSVLQGKNIIITGASRGLGRSIALKLWACGANLFLISRTERQLSLLRDELMRKVAPNQHAHIFVADLADPQAPESIFREAHGFWQALYGLVNNAGMQGPIGTTWTNCWQEWRQTLQVNLLSAVALCRLAVPWMQKGERGKIVNLSGGGATGPRPHFSAYATAKAGLIRFSETLAEETRTSGIDVNCIAPGAMATDLLMQVLQSGEIVAGKKEYEAALQVQKSGGASLGQATELVAFLMSEACHGLTGKLISAVWDAWENLADHVDELNHTDIYTLRRILPKDRGKNWGDRS